MKTLREEEDIVKNKSDSLSRDLRGCQIEPPKNDHRVYKNGPANRCSASGEGGECEGRDEIELVGKGQKKQAISTSIGEALEQSRSKRSWIGRKICPVKCRDSLWERDNAVAAFICFLERLFPR